MEESGGKECRSRGVGVEERGKSGGEEWRRVEEKSVGGEG